MNNDNLEERGFISKKNILDYVSEADIYELVFGFKPTEYKYTTSPFRTDSNPGCWFETDISTNKLRFVDFANEETINSINMNNIDCFDAVQIYFELGNFYKTLEFIEDKLIKGKNITKKPRQNIIVEKEEKRDVIINTDTKLYNSRDGRFWSAYGITKQNLIDDKVFSIKRYNLLNTKYGDILKRTYEPCYSFTNFKDNRKKLYLPFQKGKKRFITNCKADDVGELNSLPDFGEQLIISKSYKDCRVLRNFNLNSVWFQNEGMIPSYEVIIDLCRRFKNIIVFFDNDDAGIKAGLKVTNHINTLYRKKATHLYLPEYLNSEYYITDPSDLYKKRGKKHLEQFITEKL